MLGSRAVRRAKGREFAGVAGTHGDPGKISVAFKFGGTSLLGADVVATPRRLVKQARQRRASSSLSPQ